LFKKSINSIIIVFPIKTDVAIAKLNLIEENKQTWGKGNQTKRQGEYSQPLGNNLRALPLPFVAY
jgi:hypothetical protein